MFWLVAGYLFLFIVRPYEYWPVLGQYRIERIYMLLLMASVLLWPKRRYLSHSINNAVFLFFSAMVICSVGALNWNEAYQMSFAYLKLIVFYIIIIVTIQDQRQLRNFILAYLIIMLLYVGKSEWEFFVHDRYTWRMGIKRMGGIDIAYGTPNYFAASIAYSVPFLWAMLKCKVVGRYTKVILWAYGVLAAAGIVMSGSRSGMVTALLFVPMAWLRSSKKMIGVVFGTLLLILVWSLMPEQYQERFVTTYSYGQNESADASARGRIYTLKKGIQMFKMHPLLGVGPGNFKTAMEQLGESNIASAHNVYGQILGEMGLLGTTAFVILIYQIVHTHNLMIRKSDPADAGRKGFYSLLSVASVQATLLLLFNGLFSGNLYRYNLLWIGAIGVLLAHFLREENSETVTAHDETD